MNFSKFLININLHFRGHKNKMYPERYTISLKLHGRKLKNDFFEKKKFIESTIHKRIFFYKFKFQTISIECSHFFLLPFDRRIMTYINVCA